MGKNDDKEFQFYSEHMSLMLFTKSAQWGLFSLRIHKDIVSVGPKLEE